MAMMQPVNYNGGAPAEPTTIARAAGYTFETIDKFMGKLGKPIGIKSYRPYNATGVRFFTEFFRSGRYSDGYGTRVSCRRLAYPVNGRGEVRRPYC